MGCLLVVHEREPWLSFAFCDASERSDATPSRSGAKDLLTGNHSQAVLNGTTFNETINSYFKVSSNAPFAIVLRTLFLHVARNAIWPIVMLLFPEHS